MLRENGGISGITVQEAPHQETSQSEKQTPVVDFADQTIPFPSLGLTYEDQRQQQLEQQKQQEQAILRQVFEENLELQRQTSDSTAAA